MGSGSRYNNRRGRKRRGFALKSTTKPTNEDGSSASNSASVKKISFVTPAGDAPVTFANDCNFIINSDLFMSLMLIIVQCPNCAATINIAYLIQEKMDLAQFFRLSCAECKWYIKIFTSKECCRTEPTPGRNEYKISRRTIVTFRENGQCYAGMKTLCHWMNVLPPIAETTVDNINGCIDNAYVETPHKSMKNAACEVHKTSNDDNQTSSSDILNIKFSGNEAWQK